MTKAYSKFSKKGGGIDLGIALNKFILTISIMQLFKLNIVTACDIRYCSKDAWFCVKEVDIGLAADIGTLQRFPKGVIS